MQIEGWFHHITGGESQRTVAQKINVQQSKLSRQLKAGELDPEIIRDIARAYGTKPVDAFLDTGFLNEDDVTLVGVELALGYATNSQVWAEMSKRSDPEARRLYRAEGKPGVIDLDDDVVESAAGPDAEVFDFPTPDVHLGSYAADDSPNEPEEGDEGFHDGP